LSDLDAPALERTLKPFPIPVRTLDAIHLSTTDFLRRRGLDVQVATHDRRLGDAAVALGFKLVPV
jgi:hypothetical protein